MRVLILGASGMLGFNLFANLSKISGLDVYGTVRDIETKQAYFDAVEGSVILGVEATESEDLEAVINSICPEVVINCVGLIKQQASSGQHITAIEINSLLPHKLADLCEKYDAKLIHFSTDCVFSGQKGGYDETDPIDATDLYGRSKALGEVNYERHLTLRTSIIGHELSSKLSLIDWFLAQEISVSGYSQAVFSGMPTCYVSELLSSYILKNKNLSGLYNLSVSPIDKFTLLDIVREKYSKEIDLRRSNDLVINRSLNGSRLNMALGITHPSWSDLINMMHLDYLKWFK